MEIRAYFTIPSVDALLIWHGEVLGSIGLSSKACIPTAFFGNLEFVLEN